MKSYSSPLSTQDILAVVDAHPILRRVHYATVPLEALDILIVPSGPCHIIYNESRSWEGAGSHWISIYLERDLSGEVMSSLGGRPAQPEVLRFMRRNCSRAKYTTRQLQDNDSNCCGAYCLSHGMARARGDTLSAWLAQFSDCRKHNDGIIECQFMREMAFPALFSPRFNWRRALAAACQPRKGECTLQGSVPP